MPFETPDGPRDNPYDDLMVQMEVMAAKHPWVAEVLGDDISALRRRIADDALLRLIDEAEYHDACDRAQLELSLGVRP